VEEEGDLRRVIKEAERRFKEMAPLIKYLEVEVYRQTTCSSVGLSKNQRNATKLPLRLISQDYDTLISSYN
jgi:hypothetical protein